MNDGGNYLQKVFVIIVGWQYLDHRFLQPWFVDWRSSSRNPSRIIAGKREANRPLSDDRPRLVIDVVQSKETRRPAAYSAYGNWLIRRLQGDTEGKAVLALWREIAWHQTGSPIKNFKLRDKDFIVAEKSLAEALKKRPKEQL